MSDRCYLKNRIPLLSGLHQDFFSVNYCRQVSVYFFIKKGFVHAKTMVADNFLNIVGAANMDIRSFDLFFEIMSVIYGRNLVVSRRMSFWKI
jgi:phosphatidylserine/phosphatidylglycerophosphate/cardiolipin synthase-like enzyme